MMRMNATISERSNDGNPQFSVEALIRAMAPIDVVLTAFVEEQGFTSSPWYCEKAQQRFANTIQSHWSDNTEVTDGPSQRYLERLIKHYVNRIEKQINEYIVQNDDLMELIMKCSLMKDLDSPDAKLCCHVAFCVPPKEDSHLRIKVYPHHNDVGVRRVWEAGACLAEFLLKYPHYVSNLRVVELGAGVGATGLVAAGCCGAQQVHMTDYTKVCLENMQYNVDANKEWLLLQQEETNVNSLNDGDSKNNTTDQPTIVTCGYLEWDAYAFADDPGEDIGGIDNNRVIETQADSSVALTNAHVLLAADVAYDIEVLPSLAKVVRRFLASGPSKLAIIATTLRNKKTFDALESELKKNGISCDYVKTSDMLELPHIFPCYYLVQPRTDVRICLMTVATEKTNE